MNWQTSNDVPVRTVGTAFRVLEVVLSKDGASLNEVVDELDLAPSTAYNHLTTLREFGFIVREYNTYYIGLRSRQFGEYAQMRRELYDIVKEHVTDLADTVDATAGFSVAEHGRAYPIYRTLKYPVERSFADRFVFYLHTSAVGKAMLANRTDDEIAAVVDRWGLPEVTSNSITTEAALWEELHSVTEQGYAINSEESKEGLRAIGAAVHGPDGRTWGALSLSGPTYWLVEAEMNRLSSDLIQTTEDIEERLAEQYTTL